MKLKITLSIALALSVGLAALASYETTAKAQNQVRIVADTGMVTLGPNQILRVAIMEDGSDNITLENYVFRRITYTQGVCNGGICKHAVSSQITSPVVTLQTGEAALFDMIDPQGQIKVLSNNRNARVNIFIIDALTGKIVSYQNEYAGGASGDL